MEYISLCASHSWAQDYTYIRKNLFDNILFINFLWLCKIELKDV